MEKGFCKSLFDLKIGIIGLGRIGSLVYQHLQNLGVKKILLNDLVKKN